MDTFDIPSIGVITVVGVVGAVDEFAVNVVDVGVEVEVVDGVDKIVVPV